ncbi:SDR family oxidoreductase [Synoicihabitans lomoniglobus]|uniref:SDR family oxidoreductase n=1 Tax=Synoicihabitans lomoniglobus TaxID=2909285 RepID=A0AAE9ZWD1_9BACT|nr:SDR family oxidoreductase [Opitutaceae bacterium LMO-M01]WED64105.1 SDR family oxidoreductase [Opitutaceae bacterium LMO-M01]
MERLKNLIAIVTGGGSGFGEAICHQYASHGAKVMVADLDEAKAAKVAEAVIVAGGDAAFCRVDVAKSDDMRAMVAATVERFGRIDVMVNNAGMSHPNRPMLEVDEAFFDRLYAVNVKSVYLSAQHCVPVFRRQGSGCFINIGSTAAVRPRPGLSWYNGSKGAVTLLTKSLAVELAPDGIRANSINPAIADTPLLTTFMGNEDTEDNRKPFLATIPLGRLCTPADVANAAVFFADPASNFVTGVCMEVDGGRCI